MNFSYKTSVCGFPVQLHYTFFLLLILSVVTSLKHYSVLITFFEFVRYGPVLLITVTIHELAHLLATKMLGGDTSGGMVLWPLGGFAFCGPTTKGPCGDLTVAIVGPLSHIPQSLIWIGFFLLLNPKENDSIEMNWFRLQLISRSIHVFQVRQLFFSMLCVKAVQLNIMMFVFNLLPIYPLDGGRIFVSSLLLLGFSQTKTGLIVGKAGMVMSLIGGILWGVLYSRSTFSLVIFGWCAYQSWSLNRLAQNERVDEHPLFASATEANNDDSGNNLIGSDAAEMYINYDQNEHLNSQSQWWKMGTRNSNDNVQNQDNAQRPTWSSVEDSEINNHTTEQGQRWKFWSSGNRVNTSLGAGNSSALISRPINDEVEEDYGF